MFGDSSKKLNSIDRVASSSLKPFATGRVETLPPEARPWEEIYLSIQEQRRILRERITQAVLNLEEINFQVKSGLDHREFERLVRARSAWKTQHALAQEELAELRDQAEQTAKSCMGCCFQFVAANMLTDEQYAAVLESCKELMRNTSNVSVRLEKRKKSHSSLSPEAKQKANLRRSASRRREDQIGKGLRAL